MPELPEAEAMRATIAPKVLRQNIVGVWLSKPDRRTVSPSVRNAWIRKRILDVERHGKVISLLLQKHIRITITLGMSGRLVVRTNRKRHDRLALELNSGMSLIFNDFRRFGRVTCSIEEERSPQAILGPDALTASFSPHTLNLKSSRTIKAALIDQRIVAGLGNIYVCESLFRAGINPRRPVNSLTANERSRLVRAIKSILSAAVARGGSTLDDYRDTEGQAGDYDRSFAVYGRTGQPCPACTCSTGVIRAIDGGRSTFYCSVRQK